MDYHLQRRAQFCQGLLDSKRWRTISWKAHVFAAALRLHGRGEKLMKSGLDMDTVLPSAANPPLRASPATRAVELMLHHRCPAQG